MNDHKVTIEFSFSTVFWILGVVLGIWLLLTLKDIFVPLLLAFILSTAIKPLIDYLEKKKLPRALSISVFYLVLFSFLFLIFRIVIPPFIHQISTIYVNRDAYLDAIAKFLGTLGQPFKQAANGAISKIAPSFGGNSFDSIYSGARGVFSGILEAILVFVLSFYLLLSKNGIERTISWYVPKNWQKRTVAIFRKISTKMSNWLGGQVLLGFIIFVVTWIVLSLLHVNYALTLAVIAGILEVVPLIGPWISGILAVVVTVPQSPVLALIVAASFVIIQQLENHIIVPQVMRKQLGLSPITIIMAILIGGKLMGVIGILISVPVAAAISILVEEFIKIKEAEGV